MNYGSKTYERVVKLMEEMDSASFEWGEDARYWELWEQVPAMIENSWELAFGVGDRETMEFWDMVAEAWDEITIGFLDKYLAAHHRKFPETWQRVGLVYEAHKV